MRCLYCYKVLTGGETDFHPACSRRMWHSAEPPVLPYTESQMEVLALQVVRSHIAVTGVQPKLPLDFEKPKTGAQPQRFTIVGLWGAYILKPPVAPYPGLPEVEDLTMHLASLAKIATVPHSLIRLQSGNLAYITRRIDRVKGTKLHMEDMCQLTGKLTEDKYRGSYEQIGKAILKYSANPGLDLVNFFEQVVFSFLTGNADMHLKNFSLINGPGIGYTLAPAYDMVATALVNPADREELALTLSGKKSRIAQQDFTKAFETLKLPPATGRNIFNKLSRAIPAWLSFIDNSFLTEEYKHAFKQLILQKRAQLGL